MTLFHLSEMYMYTIPDISELDMFKSLNTYNV